MIELSQTHKALGCDVTLAIYSNPVHHQIDLIFADLWRQVFSFEKQFSRFLPMSELSVFNRAAGQKTPITPEFKKLLECAKYFGEKTGGLYNPFILPALQRAGYKQSAAEGYEKDEQEDHSDKRVVDVKFLEIGDTWASIPYGTALDLGGCGKGYLADQLGEYLREQKVEGYWLSLGGDIATYGLDELGETQKLNIQDASDLTKIINYQVECPEQSFGAASSGTFRRLSQIDGKDWHHIIDPITLRPAVTDIKLVTVCADSTVQADVLASCAVILGSSKANKFLKQQGVESALIQFENRRGEIETTSFGKHIIPIGVKQAERIMANV